MSKGVQNRWGWHGLTRPAERVPLVPRLGLCEGCSPVSRQQLQPSWPPASPGYLQGQHSGPICPILTPSPEGPLSRAALAAQLSSTLGTLSEACLRSSFFPQGFGGHLFPAERLDIVLTALEALQDSSIHDKQGACSVLDAALEDPFYWLKDVSGLWPWPCP